LAIRALTPLFGDARIAALAVPVLAGAVAAMPLWRITVNEFGTAAGWHAVMLLALAPYGLFLSLAYSESLFLALSLAAWYAASHQRWWWAGVAASGAALVRVNGVFIAIALAVMWVSSRRADRPSPVVGAARALHAFCIGGAYFWYVQSRSWPSWTKAEKLGWDRHGGWPWDGIAYNWRWIAGQPLLDLRVASAIDPLVLLAGAAFVVLLARRRRWAEFVYVGLSVGVVLFSNRFNGSPRYSVVLFPAFALRVPGGPITVTDLGSDGCMP